MSLRPARFHRVLYRPVLWMGGDRELTMMTVFVSVWLVVMGQNVVTILIAVGLWTLAIPVFRSMAKADPMMRKIYLRQLKYRGYYPARSRPYIGSTAGKMGAGAQWAILLAGVSGFFFVIFAMVA